MFNIPSGIFTVYYDVVDELLRNTHTSVSVTLYYPPTISSCNNCVTQTVGSIVKSVYKHGGPSPFSGGRCPLCGGNNIKQVESTDSIRLRIYYRSKDWIRIGNVEIPDAEVQVIGSLSDLPKVLKCNEIGLIVDNYTAGRYKLAGPPFPHGFGKDHYFIAYLKRT